MTRDELQKLIDTIVGELMPTLGARPQGRCAGHSVLDDCCPDRLRGVLDGGAGRAGMYAGGGAPGGGPSSVFSPPRRAGGTAPRAREHRPWTGTGNIPRGRHTPTLGGTA